MILGAIIAGGQSRRFGSDKALAVMAGLPMIEHVVLALRPWVDDLVVCGREHAGLTALPDRPAPGLGPLGGIAAALRHAVDHGFETVITLPCDTPAIAAGLLSDLRWSPAPAFLSACPVIGNWPATLSDIADEYTASDQKRSVRGWADRVAARELTLPAPVNVNRHDDLGLLDG